MKKIIFAALSVLLMFGLVGCGVHTDYTPNKDFSTGDISGDINGWGSGVWTSANADKYEFTYQFTATKDMDGDGDGILKFKVRSTAGKWDTGDFGDATLTTDGKEVELKEANFGGPEAKMTFEADHIYLITVTSKDGKVYAKVEDKGLDIIPVPYVLSGMFVHGGMYDASWGAVLGGALLEFETSTKDGVVVYKKDFTAANDNEGFKIASADWSNGWAGTEFVLDADYAEFKQRRENGDTVYDTSTGEKIADKGDTDNAVLKGTKKGSTYRLYIKTTPDGKVYAKVEEIAAIKFTFEITGLTAGNKAWINGSFWGGWENGWPLEAWGLTTKKYNQAVADANGVAKFEENFDVSTVAKVGETLSYEFKPIVSKSGEWKLDGKEWAKDDQAFNPDSNLKCELEVESAGTYVVSVDAKTSKVTVTKQ